jgi:serine/threonine protein kinase
MGRSKDCHLQLPEDEEHSIISRYHCLLDINPPYIRIRDFGSKNGTYVNGEKIGQRQENQTPEEGAKIKFPEFDLKDGDDIKLGNTIFTVGVELDPHEIKLSSFNPDTPHLYNSTQPSNLWEFVKHLLGLAEAGNSSVLPIRSYEIIKLLGRGGFGEVYLAQHKESKKFVALKVMLPAMAASEWAVEKFLRETENTKALSHPNVIKMIDYGYCEGIFFFTMEYCQSGDVGSLMEHYGGKLSPDVAIPIILQALDGLEYAHNAEIPCVKLADGGFGKGRGLVHRDFKPKNIFLGKENDKIIAKVGDYGLAKSFDLAGLSGQSCTGDKAGSPAFMSRQQVLNFKYAQPEVDVWAAAASLYSMLTGYVPRDFTNDPWLDVLRNDPVPIRQRDASIPKSLAEVIDLALVEKPEIYFKSAVELKQALMDVL